jgi:hypothetical protein
LNLFGNVHFLKCKFNLKRVFFFLDKTPNFQTRKTEKKKKKTLDVSPEMPSRKEQYCFEALLYQMECFCNFIEKFIHCVNCFVVVPCVMYSFKGLASIERKKKILWIGG